jgi:type I restriction enzyme S subunit
MELREGYKLTDLGIIPEEWENVRIDSVCSLINGRGFKPFEWERDGLPIIRIQNLNGSDEYNYFQGSYDKKLEVEHNQLLFAWSGSRGTSFGPHIWKGEKGLLNYHTWKIIIKENRIVKDYFFYALKALTKSIEENAHGASALVHTQKWEMEALLFPLPHSTNEQIAIATALSDMDALITQTEKLIAKKKAIKQGVMQRLLSPYDEDGRLKEGWVKKKLGEIFSFQSTANYSRAQLSSNEEIGYIHYGDIHVKFHTFLNAQKAELPSISLRSQKKFSVIQEGDVVMADASEDYDGVGKTIEVVNLGKRKMIAGLHTFLLRDTNLAYKTGFRGFLFESKYIKDQFYKLATGLKVYSISKSKLVQINLYLPPSDEQVDIAQILSAAISEIEATYDKLKKIKNLKQGMMQNLLTGKIRIYKPQHEFAATI